MESEKAITMVIVFGFAVLTFVGGMSATDSSPYIFNIGPEPGSLSYQEVTGIYLIQPSDLEYKGAFRLPEGSNGSSWEYSGAAMTYYPGGDPEGPADGHPGSIFAVGHDWQMYVSEISIPVPVISPSKNLDDLNTTTTLQEFHDVRAGLFDDLIEIIRVGMEYLPKQGQQTTDKLFFAWGQHLQEEGSPELIPSHMWCELDLSDPQTAGPWWISDSSISIYSVNDYMFEIPEDWAAANTAGKLLATGRFRDGGWSGQGPSLYSIGPWNDGNPPGPYTRLNATTLLHYDSSYIEDGHTMNDYCHSDEWSGGAWLTADNKSAVIFIGTKGIGECWYGCADGTNEPPWPDDCDRGWWSTGFEGQIIFYDHADLAAVARGEMETWEPQPYASLNIDQYLYNVKSTQQKYHVRAVSFDRARRLLYIFEPFADNEKSLVHVWSVEDRDIDIYYVASYGNDSNPGTIDLPWKTIQKAAETMAAGDTVLIRNGTYNERVVPRNSGSPGNYITYTAYPSDIVTIDGAGISLPSEWGGLFDVSDKSYINISGLRIINAGPNDNNAGILVDNSNYIIIEKTYIYNTVSSGIGVWDSDNIIISGNEVEFACNDGEQECITVAGTDTFEVKKNHVHHGGLGTQGGEGIDVKDGSSNGKIYKNHVHDMNRLGIYVDAWDKHTYNIDIFQNTVHDCSGDGFCVVSEAGGLLENVSFYNNIAYSNEFCGFTFGHYGEPAPSHPIKDIKVINNVFYNNGEGSWGGGISLESQDAENVVIRNNICSKNLMFQIQVEEGVPIQNYTIDHNLIDGYRGFEGEIYGNDYVEGDPMFANPSGADFHLMEGSPAIDNGSPIDAPTDDLDGNKRPQGDGYDIGPYEYVEGENKTPIASFTFSPEKPVVNQTITFNASNSTDPDGFITKYKWVFGDGTNGTGELITHSYSSVGNYTVNLTVTDNDGATNATAKMITVSGMPDLVITHKWVNWPHNCTICYNVTNICTGTAPACHNTALYIDSVKVAHDHVLVDLATGESYTGCFDGYEWGYTPQSDNITVCADNNETIVELNETNNCLTNIWMCGDVNCDGKVTMSDVRKVFNRYLDPSYPLDLPWAADVNCNGKVTMSDVRKVFNCYLDPGYELNCCCGGGG